MKRRLECIVVALAAVAVSLMRGSGSLAGTLAQLEQTAGDVHYTRLVPEGDRLQSGIYDPSVAYTADGSIGWLAYSSVTGDFKPVGPFVNTHLARSTDGGAH